MIIVKDEKVLWHRKQVIQVTLKLLKLSNRELVRGLPKIAYEKNKIYDVCQRVNNIKVHLDSSQKSLALDPSNFYTWIYLDPFKLKVWEEKDIPMLTQMFIQNLLRCSY